MHFAEERPNADFLFYLFCTINCRQIAYYTGPTGMSLKYIFLERFHFGQIELLILVRIKKRVEGLHSLFTFN